MSTEAQSSENTGKFSIRGARTSDIVAVTGIDTRITNLSKPDYWTDMFER